MSIIIIYVAVGILFVISWMKNKVKTKEILKLTKDSLMEMLPKFLSLLLLIMLVLTFIDESVISKFLGESSGINGLIASGFLGSVTLMPTVIAYPLAGGLLRLGAGYAQITMFITTLTTVGIITFKIEKEYLGTKIAFLRNCIAYIFAFFIAIIISLIMN